MTTTLADVIRVAHELWPLDGAEPWDAPGLVSGDAEAPVRRIVFAVDAVSDTVDEAIALEADLLIAHHPLLLRGVTSVAEDRYKGSLLRRLIKADCALLTAHTNADVVIDGVSDVIARRLGLADAVAIDPGASATRDPRVGIGRVGSLAEPTTLGRLARAVAELLPATAGGVRVSGEYDAPVQSIALCGGAGDSLLARPAVVASDVYITSDLRHHPASEAREQARLGGRGPALIDVSHWASEWLWLESAATQLSLALPGVEVVVSELNTDPWNFVITQ